MSPKQYLSPLIWDHQRTRAWPLKLGFWPIPTGRSQKNIEAKRPPIIAWRFFLRIFLWKSSDWCRCSCTILVPDVELTNDLLPARPDRRPWTNHDSYQYDVNDDGLPNSSIVHYPFQHQPLSNHRSNKLTPSPCYPPASDKPPYLWDTMVPMKHCSINLGLGEGDTTSCK